MGSVSAKYFSSELVTEGPYVSPELSQGGLLSPAADVYAIAAIFKELIHTKLPESKNTGEAQEIDSELLEELEAVFASALSAKASERPTASALLKITSEVNIKNAKPALLPVQNSLNLNFLEAFDDKPEAIAVGDKSNFKARLKRATLYLKSHLSRWLWLLVMAILIAGTAFLINSGNAEEEIRVQTVPEVAGLQASELIDQFLSLIHI